MRTQSDHAVQELIARACAHDEGALGEVLRLYEQRLLVSIRSELGERLRQRLESQDVLQQVYLDALRNIDQFVDRGSDSFFAWLRRIAMNRICDADRRLFQTCKRGSETRMGDLDGDSSLSRLLSVLAGSQTSPSAAADLGQHERLLRAALERLSEDQREVIELRYLKQLSAAEAAVRMDRSENAVRSLSARALIRLRELLGDAI